MTLAEIKNKLIGPDLKYGGVVNYIVDNKPMFIVEYGGGKSTFLISELLDVLGYGGKIVGFESNPYWYQDHISKGWNKYNNIFLVDIDHFNYDEVKNQYVVRYLHPIQDVEDVDLVIIDGPDLKLYSPYPSATINLLDIVEYKEKEIPYFIDGRSGTKQFYKSKFKQNLEIQDIKINRT